jgi:hypothetical protein
MALRVITLGLPVGVEWKWKVVMVMCVELTTEGRAR